MSPVNQNGVEDADVVIVGSGPIGSTFARIIGDARPDAKILMVEVGPAVSDVPGVHVQTMQPEDAAAVMLRTQGPQAGISQNPARQSGEAAALDPILDRDLLVRPGLFLLGMGAKVDGEFGMAAASMSAGVGGMGLYWSGSCPRPNGTERIPFIPAAEMEHAYEVADRLLAVSHDLAGGDDLLERMRAALAAEFDRDAPDTPPVGLTPLAAVSDENGVRVSGPSVILGGLAAQVPGFELRAGTLARRVLLEDGAARGVELQSVETGETYRVRARTVVVAADGLRTPQLLFASGVRPRALGHYLNDHLKMTGSLSLPERYSSHGDEGASPRPIGILLIPFSSGVREIQGQVHPASRSIWFSGADYAGLAFYGAKELQFSDSVTFSDTECDSFGMPAMTIHYTLTDGDRRTVELLEANARRAAAALGGSSPTLVFAPGGSSLHYQGGTRMGAIDDGESVCDSYGRVWNVDGLVVGGNNVIPTATAANPTVTSVALAVRAAQQVAAGLGEPGRGDVG
ncbi:GMC oxidoreductase [Dactylosporangium sp. CA-233914]|uniref:GMC oxidoreductase n=1 Tax=Dactylosporangium sp. CA-233914 TaxID=3239934 RepID=UPI003D906D3B